MANLYIGKSIVLAIHLPHVLFFVASLPQLSASSVTESHTTREGEKHSIQIPDIIDKIQTAESISPNNVKGLNDINRITDQLYDRMSGAYEQYQDKHYSRKNKLLESGKLMSSKFDGSFGKTDKFLVSENKLRNGFMSTDDFVDQFNTVDPDLLHPHVEEESSISHNPKGNLYLALTDNPANTLSSFESRPNQDEINRYNAYPDITAIREGNSNSTNDDTILTNDPLLMKLLDTEHGSDPDIMGFQNNGRKGVTFTNSLANDFRRCEFPGCVTKLQKKTEHHPSNKRPGFVPNFGRVGAKVLGAEQDPIPAKEHEFLKRPKASESSLLTGLFYKDFKIFTPPDNYPAYPVFEQALVTFGENFRKPGDTVGKLLNNLIDIEEHTKSILNQSI